MTRWAWCGLALLLAACDEAPTAPAARDVLDGLTLEREAQLRVWGQPDTRVVWRLTFAEGAYRYQVDAPEQMWHLADEWGGYRVQEEATGLWLVFERTGGVYWQQDGTEKSSTVSVWEAHLLAGETVVRIGEDVYRILR